MTTTISEDLLSQFRENPQQLVNVSNILQVEKDIAAFHAAIPPSMDTDTAQTLRDRIVFPGNDLVGGEPAIKSAYSHAINDSSASHFERRFWYGVVPVTKEGKKFKARGKPRLLFIECRNAEISVWSAGSTQAELAVQYRKKKEEAHAASYYNPGDNDDDFDAGGIQDIIKKVIRNIGLKGKVSSMEMIDLLIREEFPLYREKAFYLEEDLLSGKNISLQDIVGGVDIKAD
ncbi:hypothetical protein VKT23_014062 [Stygiomarasmius scandens]|uniref:Uncharacterized protein n=1 Tax=Marasmiellus scandens TaxID=2682957 RepID=A0ABR1J164_9AGAR